MAGKNPKAALYPFADIAFPLTFPKLVCIMLIYTNHYEGENSYGDIGRLKIKGKMMENNRVRFLDALRAFTIAMVVFYHVTLLYTQQFQFVRTPVPEAYQPVFMAMAFLINGPMLNSTMFFIAGYFAFGTYQRKGCRAFVKDKLKKLGIPYLGGLMLLAPAAQYIANSSWGRNPGSWWHWLREFFRPETINPHHLWFIGVLLIFFLASIPFFARLQKKGYLHIQQSDGGQSRVFVLFLLITFAIYYGLSLFCETHVFISIYILKFPPVMLPIYAAYFALGVYACRQTWFAGRFAERVHPWALAYAACIILYIGTAVIIDINPADGMGNHPLMAFAFNGMIFSWMMLLIALFKKHADRESAVVTRLSGNSYGAYILHYLIVYVVVYLMRDIPLPLMAKYIFQVILCSSLAWAVAGFLKGCTPLRTWL